MTDILNTMATQVNACIPNTPMEYLAIQMARRLNDLEHVRNYLVLFEHYPEELLIKIFRTALEQENPSGETFLSILRELTMQKS
jgi:chromosomal replication initiation ATPase DnaA